MSERKVLNKYYPPDFDPSQLPRMQPMKGGKEKVRMMIPMTIQCTVCGEFMYQGKKFNSKKETVKGETYLGLKSFRFYIRCSRCSSELTFKTNPKYSEYVAENNCQRIFNPYGKKELDLEPNKSDIEDDESNDESNEKDKDAMKRLEDKSMSIKQELEDIDQLDTIHTLKRSHESIDTNTLLNKLKKDQDEQNKIKLKNELITTNKNDFKFNKNEMEQIKNFEKSQIIKKKVNDNYDDNDSSSLSDSSSSSSSPSFQSLSNNNNNNNKNYFEFSSLIDEPFESSIQLKIDEHHYY
jgi:uncharacterized CHY-type Zn-finger protein